jgi:AcrR family transcriptional regulator
MSENISLENRLSDALLKLLADHEFKQITVTQICSLAHVNRTTFYLCFSNRRECLDFTFNRAIQPVANFFIQSYAAKKGDLASSIFKKLKVMPSQIVLQKRLYSSTARVEFEQKFKLAVNSQMSAYLLKEGYSKITVSYYVNEYAASTINTIKWWRDHPDVSPEEIVGLILTTCFSGLNSVLKK